MGCEYVKQIKLAQMRVQWQWVLLIEMMNKLSCSSEQPGAVTAAHCYC